MVDPMRSVLSAVLLCALVTPVSAQDKRPEIGVKIKDFEFLDIRYMRRSLADLEAKRGFVLFFVTNECPIVLRYLPRLRKLAAEYRPKGIEFLAVNVGPGDTVLEMAASAVEHNVPFPFVKDLSGEIRRALGVDRTATAVVLGANRRLHYRGRINRQYRFSGVSPSAGREDLQIAIDELLAGKPATTGTTTVEGCAITEPAKHHDKGLTYNRDIAPIVQRNCQDCHRAGGDAPFELMSYSDFADRAEMVAEVVAQRRMPPWYASAKHGTFANHRGLADEEVRKIVAWVGAGMVEGDAKDLPKPRVFPKRTWRIDKPDLVLKLPFKIKIPAAGYVPYKYYVFPYPFKQDTWVEQIEILPANRTVLHHANIVHIKGTTYDPSGFITGQVPGGDPMRLDPGTAKLIPKGSMILIQCHYVTTGKKEVDTLRVGLRFPRVKVRQGMYHLQIGNSRFKIQPGSAHHPVSRAKRIPFDAEGIGMFAHMHLRGKDMTFTARYPDGREEKLLLVPNYNFDWQQSYRWKPGSVFFPAGTRIVVDAHFDNSPFNPFNPDSTRTVPYGRQTFDEMMIGFIFFFKKGENLGIAVDPKTGWAL